MQFTNLRLIGFKSFVETTDLPIHPGVTGIVGPNGCGKSNLVEALRWVMGETSAKRMRGSDMDDIIFGGTTKRPARQWAEVCLTVDNRRRTAPAGFNDHDDLDIVRRIQREEGSDYRINGKAVRARDVQLLFEDNASGAQSAALVSQGKVGALIQARPQDRRLILEDAAGISGLHSRRHEAELKLGATESNLARLEDVIKALEGQLQSLRRQARHASKYRLLGEQIRQVEAVILYHRWMAANDGLNQAMEAFQSWDLKVGQAMLVLKAATESREHVLTQVPTLRQQERGHAAAYQKALAALDALEAEQKRLAQQREQNQHQWLQIQRDQEREQALTKDAQEMVDRLVVEDRALDEAQQREGVAQTEARQICDDLRQKLERLDREYNDLVVRVADREARYQSLTQKIFQEESRLATFYRRKDEYKALLLDLERSAPTASNLVQAEKDLTDAEETLIKLKAEADQIEKKRHESEAILSQLRQNLYDAQSNKAKNEAEVQALRHVLSASKEDLFPPLIDAMDVKAGYETAVAAAFGEHVMAPLDRAAPSHWRSMETAPETISWPAGISPLGYYVKAPTEAARLLAHIGVAASMEVAQQNAKSIPVGVTLVTLDGACWRWDGLTQHAGAPTTAAIRLEQRNQLTAALERFMHSEKDLTDAKNAMESQHILVQKIAEEERVCRHKIKDAFSAVEQARNRHAQAHQETLALEARRQSLNDSLFRIETDVREAQAAVTDARTNLDQMTDGQADRDRITALKGSITENRTILTEKQSALDRLIQEESHRQKRRESIKKEQTTWQDRQRVSSQRIQELSERAMTLQALLTAESSTPDSMDAQKQTLSQTTQELEKISRAAALACLEIEKKAAAADMAEKEATEILARCREDRVRAEAAIHAARETCHQVEFRIEERLQCRWEDLADRAGVVSDGPWPPLLESEQRLDALTRERDSMGPVNLRAETETEELEKKAAYLQEEKNDLTAAISRLRQAISGLNQDARQRLTAAFDKVNQYFQKLFIQLFGGGEAYLSWSDSEDPLTAGLEIFASPPGKKTQSLSLLSGGEQALTAVALIFAVFLTNPSPICVLDEVDAPLDEANVDRFCTLLHELTRLGATRFLVVTHHRLTMARMDRLFGVTMSERGVSQLVSVDLQQAEELKAIA